jgi:hypothetical protein
MEGIRPGHESVLPASRGPGQLYESRTSTSSEWSPLRARQALHIAARRKVWMVDRSASAPGSDSAKDGRTGRTNDRVQP